MSCDFFERHFRAGGDAPSLKAHLSICGACGAIESDWAYLDRLESRLRAPAPSEGLLARLREVPRRTVSCEAADEWLTRRLDGSLPNDERARLESHLGRCSICSETAAVLGVLGEIRPPEPMSLPQRPAMASVVSIGRKRWLDPRLYAAAACIFAGLLTFFAGSLARNPTTTAARETATTAWNGIRVRVVEAADRLSVFEDSFSRKVVAARETLTGYGRAAGAVALSAAGRATEGFFRIENRVEKGNRS
jgi:hypothetical protein